MSVGSSVLKTNKLVLILTFIFGINLSAYALQIDIPNDIKDNIAISILNVRDGSKIYSYNESRPMLIASNMKVITSYATLQSFNKNFTWSTTLAYSGYIKNHTLDGNLYLIGGGDPTLNTDDIYMIFDKLNQIGITKINGNLIYDDSIFNSNVTSSELYPEPFASYSANPSGLIINSNLSAINISIKNNKVYLTPDFANAYKLNNQLLVNNSKQRCDDPSNYINIKKQKDKFTLSGSIPQSCDMQSAKFILLNNYQYNKQLLNRTLARQNIKLTGKVINGTVDSELKIIAKHNSPPLQDIIYNMNKQSDNLYAKTLLLSLGAYKTINKNTYQDAKQLYLSNISKVTDFIPLNNQLENGAGLSRHEKATTSQISFLLYAIINNPESQTIIHSLPTPGESGTLQEEFPTFANKLYAKTGTLSDTKAYSGYFYTQNNTYIVSFIINNMGVNGTNKNEQVKSFNNLVNHILNTLERQ